VRGKQGQSKEDILVVNQIGAILGGAWCTTVDPTERCPLSSDGPFGVGIT
jgi:hypothetical protein